jgi:hypothetical protein
MAGTWFVVIPETDAGRPASYLESVDFREQYQPGTPEYQAAVAGRPFSAPGLGMTVVKWKGPFATEAQAQAAQNPKPSPEGPGALVNAAADSVPGVASVGDFLHRLTEGSTWIRVGEVLLGLVLIAIGVARITHAVPIATKIATTAGAGALI